MLYRNPYLQKILYKGKGTRMKRRRWPEHNAACDGDWAAKAVRARHGHSTCL